MLQQHACVCLHVCVCVYCEVKKGRAVKDSGCESVATVICLAAFNKQVEACLNVWMLSGFFQSSSLSGAHYT